MKMETLKQLRYMARRGEWMFSMDLADGFYAVGVHEDDRKFFTVNVRGQLYQLAGLPMGWNASPYVFCRLMHTVLRHLRCPTHTHVSGKKVTRRKVNRLKKGIRVLPFVDDYLFIANTREQALTLRTQVQSLLETLGLARNPKKGFWEPTQVLTHLGMEVDLKHGMFRVPTQKLESIIALAKTVLGRAARCTGVVPVKMLATLAGKAQFLYLAMPAARFYLRELHSVVSTRESWTGTVRLTNQLRRDLVWWKSLTLNEPKSLERSIFKPVETAALHVDSSSYGWGGVLNESQEARGFWYQNDRDEHITFKELKAVRLVVESFVTQLAGRKVRLHEDNHAVVAVLTHLTSRSPAMMTEVRKLWQVLDTNDIHLHPRYIRSAANTWADRLSRERDTSDWQLNPKLFRYLDKLWGPHSIDRFASMENTQVPRYKSRWRDPTSEGIDALHYSNKSWRDEHN